LQIQLVSFVLCPFVQRAVITLKEKRVDFSLGYIDLKKPPDWFRKISPLGKVPLLRVDGEVIFESAVIIDYLDEVYAPRLHPLDPLKKAQHKAWIEYGSGLLMDQSAICMAGNETELREKIGSLKQNLLRLSEPVAAGLFGVDGPFYLVDAAYAPFFMRMQLLDELSELFVDLYTENIALWAARLTERPSVAGSVIEDFNTQYINYFAERGSWLMQQQLKASLGQL